MLGDALVVATIIVIAFLPPVLLAFFLRQAEARRREPWRAVTRAFAWGASGAAFLAILVPLALFDTLPGALASLWGLVLVAPIVEEVAKALGLRWVRDDDDPEPEDGFIYGGAVGLGFAATENVVYLLAALTTGGLETAAATAFYRTLSSVPLHAAASGWAGYGLWQQRRTGRRGIFLAFLLGAIALHAAYNALASVGILLATLAAVLLAIVSLRRVFRRVHSLDAA